MEWTRPDGYTISTDPDRLDLDVVHAYLSGDAYWSIGVPRQVVERAIVHSLNFGLYDASGAHVGFARVVTDHATFGWLTDVFVLPGHRDRGLGKWLVGTAVRHPSLDGVRRVLLATKDAHRLYEHIGFRPLVEAERFMAVEHAPARLYGQAG